MSNLKWVNCVLTSILLLSFTLAPLAHGLSTVNEREARKLFGGYKITPKFCKASRILPRSDVRSTGPTICMFNHECAQRQGEVVGTCMDGFLFGACCQIRGDLHASILQENNQESDSHTSASEIVNNTLHSSEHLNYNGGNSLEQDDHNNASPISNGIIDEQYGDHYNTAESSLVYQGFNQFTNSSAVKLPYGDQDSETHSSRPAILTAQGLYHIPINTELPQSFSTKFYGPFTHSGITHPPADAVLVGEDTASTQNMHLPPQQVIHTNKRPIFRPKPTITSTTVRPNFVLVQTYENQKQQNTKPQKPVSSGSGSIHSIILMLNNTGHGPQYETVNQTKQQLLPQNITTNQYFYDKPTTPMTPQHSSNYQQNHTGHISNAYPKPTTSSYTSTSNFYTQQQYQVPQQQQYHQQSQYYQQDSEQYQQSQYQQQQQHSQEQQQQHYQQPQQQQYQHQQQHPQEQQQHYQQHQMHSQEQQQQQQQYHQTKPAQQYQKPQEMQHHHQHYQQQPQNPQYQQVQSQQQQHKPVQSQQQHQQQSTTQSQRPQYHTVFLSKYPQSSTVQQTQQTTQRPNYISTNQYQSSIPSSSSNNNPAQQILYTSTMAPTTQGHDPHFQYLTSLQTNDVNQRPQQYPTTSAQQSSNSQLSQYQTENHQNSQYSKPVHKPINEETYQSQYSQTSTSPSQQNQIINNQQVHPSIPSLFSQLNQPQSQIQYGQTPVVTQLLHDEYNQQLQHYQQPLYTQVPTSLKQGSVPGYMPTRKPTTPQVTSSIKPPSTSYVTGPTSHRPSSIYHTQDGSITSIGLYPPSTPDYSSAQSESNEDDPNYIHISDSIKPAPTIVITPKPTQGTWSQRPASPQTHTTQLPSTSYIFSPVISQRPDMTSTTSQHINLSPVILHEFDDPGYFGHVSPNNIIYQQKPQYQQQYRPTSVPTYFYQSKPSTYNVPTVSSEQTPETYTSPLDLVNFPPVRNPNLNLSASMSSVTSDVDMSTPAFVDDEALKDKMNLLVNKIVESLNGHFDVLHNIIDDNTTSTVNNKRPATTRPPTSIPSKPNAVRYPTKKPTTGTKPATTRPGNVRPVTTKRSSTTRKPTVTRKPTSKPPTTFLSRPTVKSTTKPNTRPAASRPTGSKPPTKPASAPPKRPAAPLTTQPRPTTRPTKRLKTTTPEIEEDEETEDEEDEEETEEEPEYSELADESTDARRYQCGVRPLVKSGRIVGGKGANFGEWPWQVLVRESTWLGLFTKNKCGGVLVTNKYVMTAAHCQPGFLASLVAVFGEFDISADSEEKRPITKNVKRVIVHRQYDPATFENDLALLELESPIHYDSHIVPICLPPENSDFIGRMATVTGWGRLKYGGGVPSVLQVVQVPIIENSVCQEMFYTAGHNKRILPSFLCAGYANGQKDSCEGDSGGPLVLQRDDGHWELVGTVSHGIKCASPFLPGVYMRTTYYKPWLLSITGLKSRLRPRH